MVFVYVWFLSLDVQPAALPPAGPDRRIEGLNLLVLLFPLVQDGTIGARADVEQRYWFTD